MGSITTKLEVGYISIFPLLFGFIAGLTFFHEGMFCFYKFIESGCDRSAYDVDYNTCIVWAAILIWPYVNWVSHSRKEREKERDMRRTHGIILRAPDSNVFESARILVNSVEDAVKNVESVVRNDNPTADEATIHRQIVMTSIKVIARQVLGFARRFYALPDDRLVVNISVFLGHEIFENDESLRQHLTQFAVDTDSESLKDLNDVLGILHFDSILHKGLNHRDATKSMSFTIFQDTRKNLHRGRWATLVQQLP